MVFRIVWVHFRVFSRLKVFYFKSLLVFVSFWFTLIFLGVLLEIKRDLEKFWSELVEPRRDKEKCFKIQSSEQNPRKSTTESQITLGRCMVNGEKQKPEWCNGRVHSMTRALHQEKNYEMETEECNDRDQLHHSAVAQLADSTITSRSRQRAWANGYTSVAWGAKLCMRNRGVQRPLLQRHSAIAHEDKNYD